MHTVWLLVLYSLVCVAASLAGGWVPLVMHLTHRGMQVAISFVSGIVLGIGLLHLLPHSFSELGSIDRTVLWVLAGFLFMFFLERFFQFHHHDAPEEGPASAGVVQPHVAAHVHGNRDHAHHPQDSQLAATFPWVGVAIGLTLHGLVDGLALGAAVRAETAHHALVAGLGTLLAVSLHKPFDSLTIGTLMAAAGRSAAMRHLMNAAYSLVTPLGMWLFYGFSTGSEDAAAGLGQTLGFAAGAFLCIATSDLATANQTLQSIPFFR